MGLVSTGWGFGLGYVLGARAGSERYQQMLGGAQRLAEHPTLAAGPPQVLQQRLAVTDRQSQPGASGALAPAADSKVILDPDASPPPPGPDRSGERPAAGPTGAVPSSGPGSSPEDSPEDSPPAAGAVPAGEEGLSGNRPLTEPVVIPGRGLPRSTQRKPQ